MPLRGAAKGRGVHDWWPSIPFPDGLKDYDEKWTEDEDRRQTRPRGGKVAAVSSLEALVIVT